MAVISVPRPPKSAHDPTRKISGLLISQITHMQHAERRLPLKYRADTYGHAIKTEGEAAQYIRDVTEAIHRAHEDAAKKRARQAAKRKSSAAVARDISKSPGRKRLTSAKSKGASKATAKKATGKKK